MVRKIKKNTKRALIYGLSTIMLLTPQSAFCEEAAGTVEVVETETLNEGLVVDNTLEDTEEDVQIAETMNVETEEAEVDKVILESERDSEGTGAYRLFDETDSVNNSDKEYLEETEDISVKSFGGINAPTKGDNTTWDCIWLGNYPQAEVVKDKADIIKALGEDYLIEDDYIVNADLYEKLEKATWNWKNDTVIDGCSYHRLKMDDAPYHSYIYPIYKWTSSDNYHYFKYQPIKWRVLSVSKDGAALLVADKGLDSQHYDKNNPFNPVDWSQSSMRGWLNDEFYDRAFSTDEKNKLLAKIVIDKGPYEKLFTDIVSLLSVQDIYTYEYGFADSKASNTARICKCSTYTKAMGALASPSQTVWGLRTRSSDSYSYMGIQGNGSVMTAGTIEYDRYAVRPIVYMDLTKSYLYAGTVSEDWTVYEVNNPEVKNNDSHNETPEIVKPKPKPVVNLKAASAGKGKVKLVWDEVNGADGYLIYAQKSGKYKFCGMTTQGCTFTDANALDNDWNYYWVFAYFKDVDGKMIAGSCEKYVFAKGVCQPVEDFKATGAKGSVKLTWSPSPDAEGYLIYGYHGSPKNGAKYGYIGMTTKSCSYNDLKALDDDWNFYYVFPFHRNSEGKMVSGLTTKYVFGKSTK